MFIFYFQPLHIFMFRISLKWCMYLDLKKILSVFRFLTGEFHLFIVIILGPISTVLIYCFCPPFSLKSLFTIFKKSFICFFLLLRTEHSVTSAGVLCLPNSCHVNLIYSFNSVLWEYFLFFFGMYYSTFWIFFLSLLKYCAQYHFHCGFLWGCSLRTFSLCPRIWMIAWLDRKFYLVISFSWLLWKFYSSTGCWKIWCQSDSSSLTDII